MKIFFIIEKISGIWALSGLDTCDRTNIFLHDGLKLMMTLPSQPPGSSITVYGTITGKFLKLYSVLGSDVPNFH